MASTSSTAGEHALTLSFSGDDFSRLLSIDKASAVMLFKTGIINAAQARTIAMAVKQLDRDAAVSGAARPGDYAEVEKLLIKLGGLDAALVHTGRSRVDLNRTSRRLAQRDACIAAFGASILLRDRLMAFVADKTDAVLPAYTLGVQAQPTSLGHYILGYVAAIGRSADRLKTTFSSINHSPLGAAALATSSFPMDRSLVAELLGFESPIENSFDAVQLAPLDIGAEIVGVTAAAALGISQFLADLERQYRSPRRWFTLATGKLTGVSTLMPQKRNPDAINKLRVDTGDLIGLGMTFQLKAHNVPHGMSDYGGAEPERALEALARMFAAAAEMTDNLEFDEALALAEVMDDYSTATELASALQRHGILPTLGHHYVSVLVDYGRKAKLRIDELPYDVARDLFKTVAAESTGLQFPLDEQAFRSALSPISAVRDRKGLGGSQPSEVARMFRGQRDKISNDIAEHHRQRSMLARASERLDTAFAKLLQA